MKSFDEISLSAKDRKFVQSSIASGEYGSPKEVLEDALNLLRVARREREARLAEIDAVLDRSMADVRAGRTMKFDKAAAERIKRIGRERLERDRKSV